MTDTTPALGRLIEPDEAAFRDAVHIALFPASSAYSLRPGDTVGLCEGTTDKVYPTDGPDAVGVVDPFLRTFAAPGERCYVLLFPGTVTSLRHYWTHPRFQAAAAARRLLAQGVGDV